MSDLHGVRTTQLTSKAWKSQLLIARLLALIGLALVGYGWGVQAGHLPKPEFYFQWGDWTIPEKDIPQKAIIVGAIMAAVALVYHTIIKGLIWWHHG